jgi:hypothetical protein
MRSVVMAVSSSNDQDPAVQVVSECGVVAYRTRDRWQHGVMLTIRFENKEVAYLTLTAEQAQVLKEELEKVLPIANRRDA